MLIEWPFKKEDDSSHIWRKQRDDEEVEWLDPDDQDFYTYEERMELIRQHALMNYHTL